MAKTDIRYGKAADLQAEALDYLLEIGLNAEEIVSLLLTLSGLPAFLSHLEGRTFRAPAPDDLRRVMEKLGFIDAGVRP